MARLQSSIGYQTVYVNVPDGSFAGNSCPTGYTFAKIWDEQGRYQVDVCIPLPPQAAPPPPPPPPAQNYVNVNPNIQVSPQISPVFQQQFQPSNSPASAGTVQTNTPPPSQPSIPDRPQYAPPPAYTPPPVQNAPLPPVLDSQAPTVVNNTPPPPATLPPASGSGGYATEIPSLDTVLNNPNIVKNSDGSTLTPAASNSVAPADNKKVLFIGLGALALLVLLASSKKKRS